MKKQNSPNTNNSKPSDKTALYIGLGIIGIVLISLVLIIVKRNKRNKKY